VYFAKSPKKRTEQDGSHTYQDTSPRQGELGALAPGWVNSYEWGVGTQMSEGIPIYGSAVRKNL